MSAIIDIRVILEPTEQRDRCRCEMAEYICVLKSLGETALQIVIDFDISELWLNR